MDAPEPAATAPAYSAPVTSIVRTPEEARTLAAEAFADFYGTSRSLARIKDVRTFTAAAPSRSGAAPDTTFYVVNLDDNQGYAVIAASRDVEPVLAVTESGNIESIDSIENPGAKMFFDCLNLSREGNYHPIDSSTIILPNPGWTGGDVNPWLDTPQYKDVVSTKDFKSDLRAPFAWGQIYPEGLKFPNGTAGCANVATALIFSYFEYPVYFDNGMGKMVTFDWDNIKIHKQSFDYYYDYINDGCNADRGRHPHTNLSEACYAIGLRNNSTYFETETGVTISDAHNTIKAYFPKTTDIIEGKPNAYEIIGDGIIYTRAQQSEESVGGHVFVIDGYNHQTITTTTMKRDPQQAEWYPIRTVTTTMDYNHINWGWNGVDNGYFRIGLFGLRQGDDYDGPKSSSGASYQVGFRYFVVKK